MKSKKITSRDLLFHPAHGLCRVDRVIEHKRAGQKELSYSLVPKTTNKMKVRFIIAANAVESSGFHRVMSSKEAGKILDYLKAGDDSPTQTDQTWMLAQNILSFSADKLNTRDQRKRQLLEHSVKGLVGELACAFKTPLKQAADKILHSLGNHSNINPVVLTAFENAVEE